MALPRRERFERMRDAVQCMAFLAIVVLLAPVLLLLQALAILHARWRIRLAVRDCVHLGTCSRVALAEGGLELRQAAARDRVTLVDPTRVCVTLLDGDHGFADANSQTYLFVVETRAGERLAFQASWQGAREFEQLATLRRGLERLGIDEDSGTIRGAIVSGLVFVVLGVLTLVWLVIVALGWRWMSHAL